jgi:hypothetical protein
MPKNSPYLRINLPEKTPNFVRDAPDTDMAGYLTDLNAGYWIFGWISGEAGLRIHYLAGFSFNRYISIKILNKQKKRDK